MEPAAIVSLALERVPGSVGAVVLDLRTGVVLAARGSGPLTAEVLARAGQASRDVLKGPILRALQETSRVLAPGAAEGLVAVREVLASSGAHWHYLALLGEPPDRAVLVVAGSAVLLGPLLVGSRRLCEEVKSQEGTLPG